LLALELLAQEPERAMEPALLPPEREQAPLQA
jgi:hypothetical protein